MTIAYTTVNFAVDLLNQTPADGHVEIRPSVDELQDVDGHVLISGSMPTVSFDENGQASIELPATDNDLADLNPNGFTYTAIITIGRREWLRKTFALPSAPSTVNFDDLIDIDPASGEYTVLISEAEIDALLATKVDKTTTVNGHELTGDVTVTKGDVGLGNADNTSDANKPISTATQVALDAKVDETLIDAKGDLLVGTAADTPARKAVGANGASLVADSAQGDGLRWTTSLTLEGAGDPEGVAAAPVGSVYRDTTNGHLYEKQTGSGNTGWWSVGSPMPRFAFASGTYIVPHPSVSTAATLGNNVLRVTPWFCPQTLTIARIGAEITVAGEAGSKLRLGIYNDNGAGLPGSLLIDAGQINADSATVQEIALGSPVVMPRGWYWLGGAVQSAPTTQPTVRTPNNAQFPSGVGFMCVAGTTSIAANVQPYGYSQSSPSVSGALPANGANLTAFGVAGFPRLFLKLA